MSSLFLVMFCGTLAGILGYVVENPATSLASAYNSKSIFGSGFPGQLQEYLDCLISDYRNNLKDFGVEIDPYKMSVDQTNFDLGILKGLVQLNELQLQGLSNVKVQEAKLTPQVLPVGARMQIKIVWPNVNLFSDYSSNVTILGRPLNATGNSTGALNEFAIDINAKITESASGPKVQYLSVKPTLDNSNFNLEGLHLNDVDLGQRLSSMLNQLAPFVNTNSDVFNQLVSPFLIDLINQRLSARPNKSLKEKSTSSACQFNIL